MADLCDCAYDPLLEPAPENPGVGTGLYIFTVLLLCLSVIIQAHGCWRIYRNVNRDPITVFTYEEDGNIRVTFPFDENPFVVGPLEEGDDLNVAIPLDE